MVLATLKTEYVGVRGALFRLAFVGSLLTVLTLGFYRFWMKTRLRRYYWSAIRPGGKPLEYLGEPLEKLLGFLAAVVFLSFYIGIVNLILMFLSFSLFQNNFAAYILSFIGILPILFFARYRARRYILARTRWRGVRFGLDNGAWGYAWRALVHWLVTILSLGLLWPRMTFWLEKYRTDRTYYGSAQFTQGGSWTMLYRPVWAIILSVLLILLFPVLSNIELISEGLGFLGIIMGSFVLIFSIINYRVNCFRKLTSAKTLGGMTLTSRPRLWPVIWIYVFGYFRVWLIISVFLCLVFFAIFAFVFVFVSGMGVLESLEIDNIFGAGPGSGWGTIAFLMVIYFAVFVCWNALSQAFVSLPLARHYAETLEISGGTFIGTVQQRDRDEFAEAEGFAEALDVGAAI